MDKKKQPKLPGPAAAEKADNAPSEEDEESYEEVPRHRAAETIKERERADLLPVKVNGELVYRRDAKTDNIDLSRVRIYHQRLQTHPKHLPYCQSAIICRPMQNLPAPASAFPP